MKLALVVLLIAGVFFQSEAQTILVPRFGFGLGMGMGRLGLFGPFGAMGPLALKKMSLMGPLGLGVSPIAVHVPVAVPVPAQPAIGVPAPVQYPAQFANPFANPFASPLRSPFIGKRSIEEMTINATVCQYSTVYSKLICAGLWNNFECDATAKFAHDGKFNQTLEDVKMVPAGFTWSQWNNETLEHESKPLRQIDLYAVAENGRVVNDFTFRHQEKDVKMSFVNGESEVTNGIWIKDEKCWSNLETLVREVRPDLIRLAVELNHEC